jgi:PST family polysaccharide transporter
MATPSMARRIAGGMGRVTAGGIAARSLSLISLPILTRLLEPRDYGLAALAATVVALLTVLATRGLGLGYVRYGFDPESPGFAAVESHVWRSALVGAGVCSVAGCLLWVWALAEASGAPPSIGTMVGVGVFLSVLVAITRTAAQVRRGYGRMAVSAVVGALATLVATVGLALAHLPGVWALTAGANVGLAASAWVSWSRGIALGQAARITLPDAMRRSIARISLSGWILAPLYWMISSADRWLLGSMRGPAELGIYALAASLASVGLVLNEAVVATWFPEVTRRFEASREDSREEFGREWLRIASFLAVAWLALSAAGGDLVRAMAHPSFHAAAALIPWLALGVALQGMAALANTGPWLAGDLRPTVLWWTIGVSVNVLCNVAWIPSLGALGSALAASAGFAVTAIGLHRTAQRRMPLSVARWRLVAVAGIVVAGGLLLTPPWAANPWRSLLLKLPVGALFGAATLGFGSPGWRRSRG